jgi:predicted GIY-YIG superfamily endonuclease
MRGCCDRREAMEREEMLKSSTRQKERAHHEKYVKHPTHWKDVLLDPIDHKCPKGWTDY